MDAIYLYNKYGKPVTWDQWVAVRKILDYVLTICNGKDNLVLFVIRSLIISQTLTCRSGRYAI